MPVQIELTKDNRVVLQTYTEPLTSAHMVELKDRMDREILPASQHIVHIIVDFQGITSLPTSILTSGVNMMNRAHPNTGSVICVTRSEFVSAMARIFSGVLSRRRVRVVTSLEQAYDEIDALLTEQV